MIIYIKANAYERNGGNMCKILKDLSGMTASNLLEKYGVSNKPPIDLNLLLTKIGIAAIPMNFHQIEDEIGISRNEIQGATISNGENLSIFYQENATNNRKRFTIAHEIAHCCIHSDNLIDHHVEFREHSTENTEKEYETNIFAGELLIPKTSLLEICDKMIQPSLRYLAEIFEVSPAVMQARLDFLDISYYKDIKTTKDN